jgi:membrane protein DedA with SNARE-associated domain
LRGAPRDGQAPRVHSVLGLTGGRIKLGQYLFIKHGSKVVFFGQFFAVLRFLAAFLAGVNRMAWLNFLVANALGQSGRHSLV